MDESISKRMNELTIQYFSQHEKKILYQIEYLMKIQEYQSWILKYKLKLIENPNRNSRDKTIKKYEEIFDSKNAFSKYHLVLPLFIYLFTNYNTLESALETSLKFMYESKDFLKEGDFAKTKTGVQRFITNTRFASLELRNIGLLRSDEKRFFKSWQLSPLGILVGGLIYHKYRDIHESFFPNNLFYYKWYEAKTSNEIILSKSIKLCSNPNNFIEIVKPLFQDEVIADHYDLFRIKFTLLIDKLLDVLNEGYNNSKSNTKELAELLNKMNAEKEFTDLANSIKLKSDIKIALDFVYKVINQDRE